MKDTWKLSSYVLLACIFGFLVRGTYIMIYPFKPLVVHKICILDADNVVVAGDKLYYSVHFTKYTNSVATIRRRLVNSYVLPLPDTYGSNPVGEHTIKAEIPIPEFADPDDYKIMIDYEYTVGEHPERKIVVKAESPMFRVVQGPKSLLLEMLLLLKKK